ncbi:MAG TPA: hypothetical protein PLX97_01965 [Gemmatales bacterium]|nr:hypothetical protein [Gemmatales bacterium]
MKRLLILALLITGCNQTPPAATTSKPVIKTTAKKDHVHCHDNDKPGPHQGTIFDLGKYHAEFTVDHKTKKVSVYILGDDMDTPVPVKVDKLELTIKEPAFTVELKANPDKGDKDGKCSRFEAVHDNFAKEQEFEGTVAGVIEGKPSSGKFKEEDHDHKPGDKTGKK